MSIMNIPVSFSLSLNADSFSSISNEMITQGFQEKMNDIICSSLENIENALETLSLPEQYKSYAKSYLYTIILIKEMQSIKSSTENLLTSLDFIDFSIVNPSIFVLAICKCNSISTLCKLLAIFSSYQSKSSIIKKLYIQVIASISAICNTSSEDCQTLGRILSKLKNIKDENIIIKSCYEKVLNQFSIVLLDDEYLEPWKCSILEEKPCWKDKLLLKNKYPIDELPKRTYSKMNFEEKKKSLEYKSYDQLKFQTGKAKFVKKGRYKTMFRVLEGGNLIAKITEARNIEKLNNKEAEILINARGIENVVICYGCINDKTEQGLFRQVLVLEKGECILIKKIKDWEVKTNEEKNEESYSHEMEAYELLKQIVKGVVSLKKIRVTHRNINPENIIICNYNGKIVYKLINFDKSENYLTDDDEVTIVKKYSGSFNASNYAAPEITRASLRQRENLDELNYNLCDVFSLGLTVLEYIKPEIGWNNRQFFHSQDELNEQCKAISNYNLKRILSNMLVINPNSRWSFSTINREMIMTDSIIFN
ncbi:hypothetical protein SteCoe_24748 [Stentor coeruleus]|uniref:Protein kinase domain-containing protein n=1 Tax=Stentor coeruleus TaxID=5963 RepID=A0A1R2BGT0_9CILI|nr:hypothetical protein SteCoe_24748 [Stentor coeruleus]